MTFRVTSGFNIFCRRCLCCTCFISSCSFALLFSRLLRIVLSRNRADSVILKEKCSRRLQYPQYLSNCAPTQILTLILKLYQILIGAIRRANKMFTTIVRFITNVDLTPRLIHARQVSFGIFPCKIIRDIK